jgi:hypothetical protein
LIAPYALDLAAPGWRTWCLARDERRIYLRRAGAELLLKFPSNKKIVVIFDFFDPRKVFHFQFWKISILDFSIFLFLRFRFLEISISIFDRACLGLKVHISKKVYRRIAAHGVHCPQLLRIPTLYSPDFVV